MGAARDGLSVTTARFSALPSWHEAVCSYLDVHEHAHWCVTTSHRSEFLLVFSGNIDGTLEYFRREKNIVDFDTDGAELQRVDEEQLAMRVERLVTSNNFAKQAHVFLPDPPSKVHFACSPNWINFACVLVCHLKQNLFFWGGLCSSLSLLL